MISHVVIFKMKKQALDASGTQNAVKLAQKFQNISKKISGVVNCETGMNYNNEKDFYELCLNQKFESRKALDEYLVHPLHMEVREFVFQVIDHRVVVDYDL